jgi:predicted ferric reductase
LAAGVGTLALYLGALVTFSFWFRGRIGTRTWRYLHYLSVMVFFAALWHGLQLGTDSEEQWARVIYVGTSLSLVLGIVIRLTYVRPQRARVQRPVVAG